MKREELNYGSLSISQYAQQYPDYFACGQKSVPALLKKAKQEAAQILKDFSEFYHGEIGIEIGSKQHLLCWSITATLTLNGNPIKTEDPCDLLFLELNNLILARMLKGGMVSFARKE
jgi:hypothetical protein